MTQSVVNTINNVPIKYRIRAMDGLGLNTKKYIKIIASMTPIIHRKIKKYTQYFDNLKVDDWKT